MVVFIVTGSLVEIDAVFSIISNIIDSLSVYHSFTESTCGTARRDDAYAQGKVTSQSLWSGYDRHFVGIARHNALS